jgi:hypothetical protein
LFCCFAIAPTRPCTPSDYPSLLRECEKLFQKEPKGRTFLLRILAQSGDDETKTFLESCVANVEYARANVEEALQDWSPGAISPLTKPVGTAADLDLLWCEFHATESTAPVRRIIDVLERPDHVPRQTRGLAARNSTRPPPQGLFDTRCDFPSPHDSQAMEESLHSL